MITLSGMTILGEKENIPNGELVIEKNKITSLELNSSAKNPSQHFSFPNNYYLVPGFIDLHIHGAKGADVMDGSAQALATISQALAEEGVTSFLATTMTDNASRIEKALVAVKHFMQEKNNGAQCLGLHLEGPFIAKAKCGAQNPEFMRELDNALVKTWQTISGNNIKLLTYAPELAHSERFLKFLLKENIIPSIGHTNATYEETITAINHGAKHATHLFNGMSSLQQRAPGAIAALLLAENIYAEMIVDGIHLHPAIVELIIKTKGVDKLLLITDAIRAKCMCNGEYELGGQRVTFNNNGVYLANGALAGSTLKMSDAIKNVMQFANCSLRDAIKMASENPAKTLNIFDSKGSIAIGKDADLVVLDESLNVVMTIVGGKA